jgi:hypothetical protein
MEKSPPDSENNYFSLPNEEPTKLSSLASSAANMIIEAAIPASADHQKPRSNFSPQTNPDLLHGTKSCGIGRRCLEFCFLVSVFRLVQSLFLLRQIPERLTKMLLYFPS